MTRFIERTHYNITKNFGWFKLDINVENGSKSMSSFWPGVQNISSWRLMKKYIFSEGEGRSTLTYLMQLVFFYTLCYQGV